MAGPVLIMKGVPKLFQIMQNLSVKNMTMHSSTGIICSYLVNYICIIISIIHHAYFYYLKFC